MTVDIILMGSVVKKLMYLLDSSRGRQAATDRQHARLNDKEKDQGVVITFLCIHAKSVAVFALPYSFGCPIDS